MPRQYFCSKCGEELVIKRKSLKNKQVIIDLLDPHTCGEDSKHIDNITDLEKPLSPIQKEMRNESLRHSSIVNEDDRVFSDVRETKRQDIIGTSTAPSNILSQFGGVAKQVMMPPPPREVESDE